MLVGELCSQSHHLLKKRVLLMVDYMSSRFFGFTDTEPNVQTFCTLLFSIYNYCTNVTKPFELKAYTCSIQSLSG